MAEGLERPGCSAYQWTKTAITLRELLAAGLKTLRYKKPAYNSLQPRQVPTLILLNGYLARSKKAPQFPAGVKIDMNRIEGVFDVEAPLRAVPQSAK